MSELMHRMVPDPDRRQLLYDRMRELQERLCLARRIARTTAQSGLEPAPWRPAFDYLQKKLPGIIRKTSSVKAPKQQRIYPPHGFAPDPGNPRPDLDPWAYTPFADSLEQRKTAFLEYCAQRQPGTLMGESARAALGREPSQLSGHIVGAYAKRLAQRFDCADFFMAHVLHALHMHQQNAFLSESQYNILKHAVLGFKYWIDEPGACRMIYWSENHKILFHTMEYLAGQMFPDEIFTNNGMSGAQRMDHARPMIREWMDHRARWGYSEWCSNEYYAEDLQALLLLSEYCADGDLARAAAISTDLLLLDVACDLFYGFHAGTHGRCYEYEILTGRLCDMAPACKVVWGLGTFGVEGIMPALALSTARKYAPPDIIIRIGQDNPQEFESHHRHGIPMNRIQDYGLNPKSLEHITTLWAMGAYTERQTLDTLIKAADAWNLWQHPFLSEFGGLNTLLPRNGTLGELVRGVALESDRALLGEVNKTTYRTPDYALSTAQDYRPGTMGAQHHIWQATLSPDAMVFTTNPGSFGVWDYPDNPDNLEFHPEKTDFLKFTQDRLPNYWAGQNRLPRAAQYKNLSIILYNIDMRRAIGERGAYDFTHAFFPRWAFDEIHEEGGWIFGRVQHGYTALFSARPCRWKNPGHAFTHDVAARGKTNVWICHMGRQAVDGPFEDFMTRILEAWIMVDLAAPGVRYKAPGIGGVQFAWDEPLVVNGACVPLGNFKRMHNNYVQSDFDTGHYTIRHGGQELVLEFAQGTRRTHEGNA